MLEGVIPLETFPFVEWHYRELADVPSFAVLKTQICVTRPQCVNTVAAEVLQSKETLFVCFWRNSPPSEPEPRHARGF